MSPHLPHPARHARCQVGLSITGAPPSMFNFESPAGQLLGIGLELGDTSDKDAVHIPKACCQPLMLARPICLVRGINIIEIGGNATIAFRWQLLPTHSRPLNVRYWG